MPWAAILPWASEAGVTPVLVRGGCRGYRGKGAVGVQGSLPHTHTGQARLTLDLPCSGAQSNHAPFLPQVPPAHPNSWLGSSRLLGPQGGAGQRN